MADEKQKLQFKMFLSNCVDLGLNSELVFQLTAMEVRHIGLHIHDARDSLPDPGASSCIAFPHFKNSFGPCVRYVKVVYSSRRKTKSEIKFKIV